ncbi:MAG: hypothetical protein LBH44_04700 [Treponema sp.]|jgi:hypothetical protein|nr:hypothetical protein [Treponema sp.]
MIHEERLKKVCSDFSLLNEEQQDYILGILQALVFARGTALQDARGTALQDARGTALHNARGTALHDAKTTSNPSVRGNAADGSSKTLHNE